MSNNLNANSNNVTYKSRFYVVTWKKDPDGDEWILDDLNEFDEWKFARQYYESWNGRVNAVETSYIAKLVAVEKGKSTSATVALAIAKALPQVRESDRRRKNRLAQAKWRAEHKGGAK